LALKKHKQGIFVVVVMAMMVVLLIQWEPPREDMTFNCVEIQEPRSVISESSR
jgi:hypothetical protein